MEYVLIFCIYDLSIQGRALSEIGFSFSISSFLHMRKLNSLKRVALNEFNF